MSAPWTFDEARHAAREASRQQRANEDAVRDAARAAAAAEQAYRVALARKILELHAEGKAWTVTADLARGDELVARLKYQRDVAEGVREAAVQASWRASADRRDVEAFVGWSMRRELAEAAA